VGKRRMVHIDIPPIVGYSLGEVSIQQANPKGFQRMFLVQIKLFWLKSSHIETGLVKPLGFLTLM
jgi:hypothetical protein